MDVEAAIAKARARAATLPDKPDKPDIPAASPRFVGKVGFVGRRVVIPDHTADSRYWRWLLSDGTTQTPSE